MARQFEGGITRDALHARLSGEGEAPGLAASSVQVAEAASKQQPGTDEEQVKLWLTLLHELNGVPFNYLVPAAEMLPAESIRFFQVDNNWIEALLDGAFSVGFAAPVQSTTAEAHAHFLGIAAERARLGPSRRALLARARSRTTFTPRSVAAGSAPAPRGEGPTQVLSGFLVRSAVVAGWPGMEVHGFSDAAGRNPLQIVRMETVAPSLLMCIFAGVVARVDFQEPGEAVHFGVDANGAAWQKELRYANGNAANPVGSFNQTIVPVNLRRSGTPAIIPLDTLAQLMSNKVWTTPPPTDTNFTAAQFALEMVEGVQKVTFQVPSANP
jgi:hypothetical protein